MRLSPLTSSDKIQEILSGVLPDFLCRKSLNRTQLLGYETDEGRLVTLTAMGHRS